MYSIIKTFTLSILMCFQVSAFAQTETTSETDAPAQQEDNAGVEKITVTGSHIKRIQVEGPSPVQVLDREQMERTGYNSVSDVLRDTGVSSFGSTRERSGSSAGGTASVSLRGLGSNRTLVLMNGRRLPGDPLTQVVDLNNIPFEAVERIEILKDGASALYGSDAVGGVVNIIMKKDFTGQSVSFSLTGNTEDFSERAEAGSTITAAYTYGLSTDKLDLVTVFNYRNNEKMFSSEREYTSTGRSPTGDIPSTSADSGNTWTPDAACPADRAGPAGTDRGFCFFDFTPFSTELPTIEQFSNFTEATFHVTPITDIYTRASFTHKKTEYIFAPAPGVFNVGGANRVRTRIVELGNRDTEFETNSIFALAGVRTEIGEDMEFEFDVSYNIIDRVETGFGLANRADFNQLITNGDFVPGNAVGSRIINQANFDAARLTTEKLTDASLLTINTLLTGSITDELSFAIGASHFRNTFELDADEDSLTPGAVFGSAGFGKTKNDRSVTSLFGELGYLPLDNLEFQLAARFDEYNDFGGTFNPKAAFRYQPVNKLMIRGSVGTGFRAPDLDALFGGGSSGFPFFIDGEYCRRQGGDPNTPACQPDQYKVTSPANPELEEETFLSANLGALYQVDRDNSIGLDFFMLNMDNVADINYESLTAAEAAGVDLSQFGINIDRTTSGRINDDGSDGLFAPLLNQGKLRQFGVDLTTQHAIGTENFGSFNVLWNTSYLFKFDEQLFPGLPFTDSLGDDGKPRWRSQVTIAHTPKELPLITSFTTRYIDKHECIVKQLCERDAHVELDLQAVYRASIGNFTLGIKNLLNTEPPLDSSNPSNQLDNSLYNTRQRTIFLGYRQDI